MRLKPRIQLSAGVVALAAWLLLAPSPVAAQTRDWTLELTVRGQKIEGAPVAWNAQQVVLLGRDGQLWRFAPEEATQYRKTADGFRGYSAADLRAALRREFGNGFEVTSSTHYLVVHPSGSRTAWAEWFEDLYRRFVRYFSVRGFSLAEPPFPLIAIVCRDQAEFARYASRHGPPPAGILGFYSIASNRIVLYEASQEGGGQAAEERSFATVVHEATHQMAFNTGIHSRAAEPPVWVAEGLATVFEGVVGGGANGTRQSRINRVRFGDFQKNRHTTPASMLAEMVAQDQVFRTSPATAYATAWALTFYLIETQPSSYWQYLGRTAARPPLEPYSAAQRTADFTALFGTDWNMLEARLKRFLDELSAR